MEPSEGGSDSRREEPRVDPKDETASLRAPDGSLPPARDSAPERGAHPAPLEEPGAELIELTGPGCLGMDAGQPAIPGNPSKPVAVFDATHNYVTFFSKDHPHAVMLMRYDGTSCSGAVRVNPRPGGSSSHDAPSIFVDGMGYLYTTYFGPHHRGESRPALRRTRHPNRIDSWEPEERSRLFDSGETNGFRLDDGSVVMVGSGLSARIDVIEPGGAYRWPAAHQVIWQDVSTRGSGCGQRGNRFTKAVFEPGWQTEAGQLLVVTWGWGGGFYPDRRPDWLCPDIRHYGEDSHEVFFAYSNDEGLTWQNKDGSVRVNASPCRSDRECRERTDAIRHNDPAFIVTRTRQKSHRAISAHDDGTIYLAFERSEWCDRGDSCASRTATHPGALMMLKFELGGPVQEVMVDPARHSYTAGIRKAGRSVYIWSKQHDDQTVYEYRSDDEGRTWSKTEIVKGIRIQGVTRIPGLESVRFVISASGHPRALYYYRRTF